MKKSIRHLLKKLRHSWITVWLVMAVLALSCVFIFAVYTGVSSVKRVVSTGAGAGLLFSSDYMSTGTQYTTEHGDYSAYDADENPTYQFIVSNHPQGDRHIWYTANNIEYNVSAELVKNQKYTAEDPQVQSNPSLVGQYKPVTADDLLGKTFQIGIKGQAKQNFSAGSAVTFTFTGSNALKKTEPDDDTFELVIDKSELLGEEPSVLVKLTAIPTNVSGGEVDRLYGYMGICKRATGDAKWSGKINDENYTTTDYDAYNYVISGIGKGTFYFAYDSSKLSPNMFFTQNNSGIQQNDTLTNEDWGRLTQYKSSQPSNKSDWKLMVLTVDSSDKSRYEIQLYKTSGDDYRQVIDGYVDFGFVVSEQEDNNEPAGDD